MHSRASSMAATKSWDATNAVESMIVVACSAVILAALILGVGIPDHMVLRHIVQTFPVWCVVILGIRRSRLVSWVGLPEFVFWLVLMSLIWLYLLGFSHVLSGNFTAWEISMTIVVGMMCVIGIGASVKARSSLSALGKAALFVAVGLLQFLCFRVSLLPAIAHR